MKNAVIISLIILLGVVFISGCSFNTGFKTYESNGIYFQYPYSWDQLATDQISASSNGSAQVIAAVADPNSQQNEKYQTLAFIQRADTNVSLSQAIQVNRDAIVASNGNVISQQDLTVNGASATELLYTITTPSGVSKKERLVAFDKNNQRYYIICSAPANDFDAQQSNFNQIINSFQVK